MTGEVQGVDLDGRRTVMVAGGLALLWALLTSTVISSRRDAAVHEDVRYRDRV